MNDYLTSEYIEECKKIQRLIEPEVGMKCALKEFPLNDYIITLITKGEAHPSFLNKAGLFKIKIEKLKQEYTLLPDLGWLMRKIVELRPKPDDNITLLFEGCIEDWFAQRSAYCNEDKNFIDCQGDTPELACLRELIELIGENK